MEQTSQIVRKENGSLDADAYKHLVGNIDLNGFSIEVIITDARMAYGRLDFCVTPKSGSGSKWVSASRVALTGGRTIPTTLLGKATTTEPSFRAEVARRKALRINEEAQGVFTKQRSILDLLIKKEESNE